MSDDAIETKLRFHFPALPTGEKTERLEFKDGHWFAFTKDRPWCWNGATGEWMRMVEVEK